MAQSQAHNGSKNGPKNGPENSEALENGAAEAARADEVAVLLEGAVDLHCHSGPAAMPRILDHHEAMQDAAAAKFRALLYKDHFYLGVAQAKILEKLFPETGVKLYS